MERLEQLQQEIDAILAGRFDTRITSRDVDLIETGLVDSVRIVELVLELERRFGVSLPFEELEIDDFRTVARLAARIARTLPAAG
jgi:D-alanine--poly(phosphoribitol) ligase subunit 2